MLRKFVEMVVEILPRCSINLCTCIVLKLAFSEEGNNHMVLAMKITPSFTAEMVVDYYAGKLFGGVLTQNGKFEPPHQCNPRYTVQVGKFNVFLDGSKLQNGQLHSGARTFRSYKYLFMPSNMQYVAACVIYA